MRLAILSDVHANLPAFEAALAAAARWRADEVMLLGDLVNGGPHPNEVVALARKRQLPSLLGNHEDHLARGSAVPPRYFEGRDANAAAFAKASAWTLLRLERAHLAWLAALPPTRRLVAGGLRVLLVHGSPRSPWESLGPRAPDDVLLAELDRARADVLVAGHTHLGEVRDLGDGKWFLNPGSVGRPQDGPEASLLLADLDTRRFALARAAFDGDAVLRDSLKANHPAL